MYHATDIENRDFILHGGLEARQTAAATDRPDKQYGGLGVWLFASLSDAIEFARNNHLESEDRAIFLVDAEGLGLIPDPVYDAGVSWICTGHIDAERLSLISEEG